MQRNIVLKIAAAGLLAAAVAASPATAGAKKPGQLNDLEIAHVAYTAGAIDIRTAHLALAISDNPKIRAFASTMIRDHTAVNKLALKLVKKLRITPRDNSVSKSLMKQARALWARLLKLRGAEFDRAYAKRELGYHQFVNGALAKVFIPNAKNRELKALLKAALATFKVHEHHAVQMARSVSR